MVPHWFGRWAEALVDSLDLQENQNVLDVACGTGVTTRLAKAGVGPSGRVDGLDINQSMLAKAQEIAANHDIGWIKGDVGETGLPSGSYDVIMSQHGYHYFPDKPRALAEFRRLLVEGGRMAFSIWDGHSPYTLALCDAVQRHISVDIADKQRSQRETSTSSELISQVEKAGFSAVEVHRQELMIDVPPAVEFVPLHLGSMPIAEAFHALSEAKKTALIEDVSDSMAMYVQEDSSRLLYQDSVHVVFGTN